MSAKCLLNDFMKHLRILFNQLQIKALTVKYSELEKTLIKSRTQSKKEVTTFLDDDVGDKLNEIQKGVKRIDSRLCSQNQVI